MNVVLQLRLTNSGNRGQAILPSMRNGYTPRALLAACFLSILASPSCAQSGRELDAWVESHGSVPPVPAWFSCVRELDRQPYDKVKSQACLRSILSHPEVLKGRVSLHHYKLRDTLIFNLESPSLSVTDVDLGIAAADLAQIHELLAINGNALRPGEGYEEAKEKSTRVVLDLLLRSQGRRAGVSKTVHLDFNKKIAQVGFKIWEGPADNPQMLVPPYAEPCKIMNGFFNWTDADDLSPVHFVEGHMKTKWCGCFSDADFRDDAAALKEMKFLKEANISVAGSGNMRSISVHLRGGQIPIAHVSVRGYGLLEGLVERETPPLTIHPGDIYSRSAAWNLEKLLQESFAKDGRQVRVFSDVEVSPTGDATLTFSILAYPDDAIHVNDVQYDGSFHGKH